MHSMCTVCNTCNYTVNSRGSAHEYTSLVCLVIQYSCCESALSKKCFCIVTSYYVLHLPGMLVSASPEGGCLRPALVHLVTLALSILHRSHPTLLDVHRCSVEQLNRLPAEVLRLHLLSKHLITTGTKVVMARSLRPT